MKKAPLYYTILVSAAIAVFMMGIIRELVMKTIKFELAPLLIVLPLLVASLIYIGTIKKIKFDFKNLYFLESRIYLKVSIIVLVLLSLYYSITSIISSYLIQQKYPNSKTSPIAYVILLILALYAFFMIKQFIAIQKTSKTDVDQSDADTNEALDVNSLDKLKYKSIGSLDTKLTEDQFIKNTELNIDKKTYVNYKPKLYTKQYNENGDLLLGITNKEELNFNVLLINGKNVYIKHHRKTKNENLINLGIINFLSQKANA